MVYKCWCIFNINSIFVVIMSVAVSQLHYSNSERENPSEAVCLWGFQYVFVCQHWGKQWLLWPGINGGLRRRTQTCTLLVITFFYSLLWKVSSGPSTHFKHICGQWRWLQRTFLSHSAVCLSIKTQSWGLK